MTRFVGRWQRRDVLWRCRAASACGKIGACDWGQTPSLPRVGGDTGVMGSDPIDHQHRCRCKCGDAFAPAGEAQAFGGGRLDADAALLEAQQLGDAPTHGVAVRRDPGGLAQEGDVDVADHPAAGAYKSKGLAQEDGGGGALPARVRVGEVLADVAGADGAEQRVGERVQGHVGIGVALQGVGVGNPDAAQPDVVAGNEPVHVEALSGAHVGSCRQCARPWRGPPRW